MMGLYISCQLCGKIQVFTTSIHKECLCNWCANFVKQKRREKLDNKEIRELFKKQPYAYMPRYCT